MYIVIAAASESDREAKWSMCERPSDAWAEWHNVCRVVLALLGSTGLGCDPQDRPPVPRAPVNSSSATSKSPDAIQRLISKNGRPEIGPTGRPIFPPTFDWEEQSRTWREVAKVASDSDALWPVLVDHLADERYCVTVTSGVSGRAYIWTIGDVCRQIIEHNLTQAYYENLTPESFDSYRSLRAPPLAIRQPNLQEWCRSRWNKELWELQLETCRQTVRALADHDALPEELRTQWSDTINATAAALAQEKAEKRWPGFGINEYEPYAAPGKPDPFAAPAAEQ